MKSLKSTKIYRGGVTAPSLQLETTKCSFHVNTVDETLEFRFNLASKGGGTTAVLLRVGINDLPEILEEVATKAPEQVGVLSDCAALANKKNLEALMEALQVQDNEKARAESLIARLKTVEEFVSEKYYQAPTGEDEREGAIKEQLDEVMGELRSIS